MEGSLVCCIYFRKQVIPWHLYIVIFVTPLDMHSPHIFVYYAHEHHALVCNVLETIICMQHLVLILTDHQGSYS